MDAPRPTIEQIKRAVAADYRIPVACLESERQDREAVRPRQVAMYLAKRLTPKTLAEIGRRLGDRDHSTVSHGVRQIERLRAEDEELDRHVRSSEARLGAAPTPAQRPELQLSFLSGPLFDAGDLFARPNATLAPRPRPEPAPAPPTDRRPAFNIVRTAPEQLPPRVDRSSCPRCGTRRAIGCRHTATRLVAGERACA